MMSSVRRFLFGVIFCESMSRPSARLNIRDTFKWGRLPAPQANGAIQDDDDDPARAAQLGWWMYLSLLGSSRLIPRQKTHIELDGELLVIAKRDCTRPFKKLDVWNRVRHTLMRRDG